MCFEAGVLQEYLDGEAEPGLSQQVADHLSGCPGCRSQLEEMRGNALFAAAYLRAYREETEKNKVDLPLAWTAFTRRKPRLLPGLHTSRGGPLPLLRRFRWLASVAVVALVVLAFSSAPVRSAAGQFLRIFRVEKMQMIRVTPGDLQQFRAALEGKEGLVDMAELGRVEVDGRRGMIRSTLEEARRAVGFPVGVPAGLPGGSGKGEVYYEGPYTLRFTLNVVKFNELLRSLGSTRLLPPSADLRTFSARFPGTVTLRYPGENDGVGGSPPVTIHQARSPELVIPEGINAGELREALLELPILPPNIRAQLASIEDWQHTLPVPVMKGEAREVEVDGVRGLWIGGEGPYGALVWQRDDGVITVISGRLTWEEAGRIAESLRW